MFVLSKISFLLLATIKLQINVLAAETGAQPTKRFDYFTGRFCRTTFENEP